MSDTYPEGFEPIDKGSDVKSSYPEGFEPIDNKPKLKESTQKTISDTSALESQLQSEAQKPAISKVMQELVAPVKGLAQTAKAGLQGIVATPQMLAHPEQILPTIGESGRRMGMDLVNVGRGIYQNAKDAASQINPASLAVNPLSELVRARIAVYSPRTLSPEELQTKVEEQPMNQAISESRNTVPTSGIGAGANAKVAEGVAQVAPWLIPLPKGLKMLKGEEIAASDMGRSVRSAIKPSNAQIGTRIESAANKQMGEIFHINPEADKAAATPFEGFAQSVEERERQLGSQLSDIQKKIGQKFDTGDEIANKLEQKAQDIEAAGEPKESVQYLKDRAEQVRGDMTDLQSLQEGTTLANWRNSPFFSKSRVAQDPIRGSAEKMANDIIAKTGGDALNKAFETVGGSEGAGLRKQWSDLKLLKDQANERVNKLINNAPKEVQNAAVESITSLKGLAGMIGLLHGYASGALSLGASAVKSWQKNAAKELNNSNSIISKLYDNLRENPPERPIAQPPVISKFQKPLTAQEQLNLKMAQGIKNSGEGPSAEQIKNITEMLQNANGPGQESFNKTNSSPGFNPPSYEQSKTILDKELQSLREREAASNAAMDVLNKKMVSLTKYGSKEKSPEMIKNLTESDVNTYGPGQEPVPPKITSIQLPSSGQSKQFIERLKKDIANEKATQLKILRQKKALEKQRIEAGSNLSYPQ